MNGVTPKNKRPTKIVISTKGPISCTSVLKPFEQTESTWVRMCLYTYMAHKTIVESLNL